MNRIALLAAVLVLSSGCAALLPLEQHPRVRGRRVHAAQYAPYAGFLWMNVVRLPRASLIAVVTRDGTTRTGRLFRANPDGLWLEAPGTAGEFFERDHVLQVDLLDAPGTGAKAVARGVLLGAVIGAGLGAIALGLGSEENTPRDPGQVVAASAAIGAMVGGQAVTERQMPRTVYIAP